MKALLELQRVTSRELDRAQLGEPPSEAFAVHASTALAERRQLLRTDLENGSTRGVPEGSKSAS